VTACAIAPAVALYEKGSLDGFWNHPFGPLTYLQANWFTGMRQYAISGLLANNPFSRLVTGPVAFDGSLWSLVYELCCYVMVAALAGSTVLRRAKWIVVLLTVLAYSAIVNDFAHAPTLTSPPPSLDAFGPLPFIGMLAVKDLVYLGFLFLLGASARLYMHRLPMHGGLAAAGTAALVVTLWQGAFFVCGLPALAYLLLYAAVALPRRLHAIGRRNDYSYGIYIYGYPVQQVVALVGAAQYGLPIFLLLSAAATLALAARSWHLIERPAMSRRGWMPPLRFTVPNRGDGGTFLVRRDLG
jgi:peptidoglycan/LPS O-acetylase OafA/YrhL